MRALAVEERVSVFRLLLTCLWVVSLGVFLVYLEAEHVRMRSQIHRWETFRRRTLDLRDEAVYEFWRGFQKEVPGQRVRDYLGDPRGEGDRWRTLH